MKSSNRKFLLTPYLYNILESIRKQRRGIEKASKAEGYGALLAAWDRLLAPGNEVIPDEVRLKMNHLLPIPYRHFFFFFLGPRTLRPSILQRREG